jgi:hypothetical protein
MSLARNGPLVARHGATAVVDGPRVSVDSTDDAAAARLATVSGGSIPLTTAPTPAHVSSPLSERSNLWLRLPELKEAEGGYEQGAAAVERDGPSLLGSRAARAPSGMLKQTDCSDAEDRWKRRLF